MSATTIARSISTGETVRAGRGLYQLANAELDVHGTLADVSKLAPKGVICLPDFDFFLLTTCFYVFPPIFEALHFAGFPLLAVASIDPRDIRDSRSCNIRQMRFRSGVVFEESA